MRGMAVSRRAFIGGASAAIAAPRLLAFRAGTVPEASGVTLGVISDTHVTGPESAAELARAFRFFAARKVDGVVHCGDITDLGYRAQLDVFLDVWRREMPPDTPLVAALGNRDLSDTAKFPAERREAERHLLMLSDPAAALRKLGESSAERIRVRRIKGVAVVAADWRHEGELEAFMLAHPELRDPKAPLVTVQHPHPAGTVFNAAAGSWMADDGRATCYLRLFPRAWSFSGHSHFPFTAPFGHWHGDFTAAAAGSFYLGPSSASGGREVSLLTLDGACAVLERLDLDTWFCETVTSVSPRRAARPAATGASDTFVFAQWNIGHFSYGRNTDTKITAAESSARAADYRRTLTDLGADFVGLCEFSPNFDRAGARTRETVFGGFAAFEAGPHKGYHCNAVASARAPLRLNAVHEFSKRCQPAYSFACETEIRGERALIVETHLDLSRPERTVQIAELVEMFGSHGRVIVSGDFNVDDGQEFKPFKAAGFAAANFGRFGVFNTHRRRRTALTPAIDNVFVKGFRICDARTADDEMVLSDHRIMVCRLAPCA